MNGGRLNDTNELLRRALALAGTDPQMTLNMLSAGLEKARSSSDQRGVTLLARHAGTVCVGLGDLSSASAYFDEALSADPEDAYVSFSCGDIRRRLGKREEARSAFTRSLELAREQSDTDMVEMAIQALARLDAEAGSVQ